MERFRFPRSRRTAAAVVAAIVAISAAVFVLQLVSGKHTDLAAVKRNEAGALPASDLRQRFRVLSARHSNKCGLRPESLKTIAVSGRLKGSCCSPMNYAPGTSARSGP